MKFLLWTALLLSMASCRKDREVTNYDGDYTLNGRVLDELSRQGIPNAMVGVIERNRDASSHLSGKTVAYAKAEGNGSFSLKFYADSKENNYELTASSSGFFERTDGGTTFALRKMERKIRILN